MKSLGEFEKISQEVFPDFSEDRLRMKLHPIDRELSVLEAHDFLILRPGRHDKHAGERLPLHDQRVVAGGVKRIRQAFEEAGLGMMNL